MDESSSLLEGGFANPVFDAQLTFRAILNAMAQPGTVQRVADVGRPSGPLAGAAAAALLTLCDFDTPVWLDAELTSHPEIKAWIRVQSGADIVSDPAAAAYGFIANPVAIPAFEEFEQGSQEYPDRSATLILQAGSLAGGSRLRLEGPGIPGHAEIFPRDLPADFVQRLAANRARFPRGVDLLLVDEEAVIGLPRTTRVTKG